LARVNDPRRPGEPDVGDAVVSLQAGQVVVSTLTPRDRSSATSARTSLTYQDACVWVSAVPVVLLVTLSWVPPPQRKVMAASLSLRMSQPSRAREKSLAAARSVASSTGWIRWSPSTSHPPAPCPPGVA